MKTWEIMRSYVKEKASKQGLKQKFLAQKCGYDEKTFSLLINGKKQITVDDIKKFCTGMEILPNDLIDLDSA